MNFATLAGQIVRPSGQGYPGALFTVTSMTGDETVIGRVTAYGDAAGNYSIQVVTDTDIVYYIEPAIAGIFNPFYVNAPAANSTTHIVDLAPITPPPAVPISAEMLRAEFAAADAANLVTAKAYADANDDQGKVFSVPTPAATWSINHTFGRVPAVSLFLNSGEEVDTDVVATDTQVVATWPVPVAGKMVLA